MNDEHEEDVGLGALRSTHRQGRQMRAAFATLIVAAVACAALAVRTRHVAPFALGVAVLFALVPLWMFSEMLLGLGSSVEVWDEGLVVRRRWTDPVRVPWDEIDGVYLDYQTAWRRTAVRATLTTHAGRRIAVPRGLTGAREILEALDRYVERPLVAPARHALAAGETLDFGAIVLGAEGITVRGRTTPWPELDHVEVDLETIAIFGKDKHLADVPVREVPHPRVLVVLLRSRVKVESPAHLWAE